MNVGHPSNLARFFELYGGTVDRAGKVHRQPDIEAMRKHLFSTSVSDSETRACIKRVYNEQDILLEPHGTVGWRGLETFLHETGWAGPSVVLETAHPAKFPEAISETLGFAPEKPRSLKNLDRRAGKAICLPAKYHMIKDYLCCSNSSVLQSVPSANS